MIKTILFCLVVYIGATSNLFAQNEIHSLMLRADEFFNQEDISNQSDDYPNLGIFSDIGLAYRLLQISNEASLKLLETIKFELQDIYEAQEKTRARLAYTENKLKEYQAKLTHLENKFLPIEIGSQELNNIKHKIEGHKKQKAQIYQELKISVEEVQLKIEKLANKSLGFRDPQYQKTANRQILLKKLAALGTVFALTDLVGQFVTKYHSPGEEDNILGSGVWEFLEVTAEEAVKATQRLLEDELEADEHEFIYTEE